MADAKHTKGALHVVIEDGEIPSAKCRLESDSADHVAYVTLPFPFDTNYNERDANARRLALAWNCHDTLLETLQTIADVAVGEGDVCELIARRARAAIALAAGDAA
jgi:hypothetical protein